MFKILISLLALLLSQQILAFYPISPRPLRKLVIESEFIIRGKVLELGKETDQKKSADPWQKDFALIEISEVLQGKLTDKILKVYFSPGMICPAPGIFYANEEVLTFLYKNEKGEGYSVHALSYGVKHELTEEGFGLYKARISEMQEIQKIKNVQEQEDKILEWLVTCAENKITRWEGTYELSPGSDFMSYYDDNETTRKDIRLNSSQKKRLLSAVLKEDKVDYYDIALIDITMGLDDEALLKLLKKSLLGIDSAILWYADFIMDRIVRLTAEPELEKIYKKFSELYSYDDDDMRERKKLLELFRKKMERVEQKKIVLAVDRHTG